MSRDETGQTNKSISLSNYFHNHFTQALACPTKKGTFRLSLNTYTTASETHKYSVNLSLQKTVKYLDATVKGLVHDSTEKRREKCSHQKLGTG